MSNIRIQFYLNNDFKNIEIPHNITVLEYIRNYAGLTGTKLGCGEGDCGTCTVAIGTLKNGQMFYKAINSCLVPAAKMHHKHIVTIEGISNGKHLHPIQTAILENHATQCGFCTPGITMSLFTYFFENNKPEYNSLRLALEGNLCRCTGYQSIKNAATWSINHFSNKNFEYPAYFENIKLKLQNLIGKNINTNTENSNYIIPKTKTELFHYIKNNSNATIIAGGTDLFVQRNLQNVYYDKLIDISEIDEFHNINFENNTITIGSAATLSEIFVNKYIKKHFNILHKTIEIMASKQIRNIATLSGNIANASPVADSVPVLLSAEALLYISSPEGMRKLTLDMFYQGYKQIDLNKNEIIEKIEIPLKSGCIYSFEKSSKRKSVDISTVNSSLSVSVKNSIFKEIHIAFGGIAPTPVTLKNVEQFFLGKQITEKTIIHGAKMAAGEVKPITDMRGGETYRRLLVQNHIIKHFHKLFPEII